MLVRTSLMVAIALLVAGCSGAGDIAGSCVWEDEYQNTCTLPSDDEPGALSEAPDPVIEPRIKPDPLY
jgi:hypothetical protein